jgi:hypothetical protein
MVILVQFLHPAVRSGPVIRAVGAGPHRLRFHYPSVKTLCDDGIRCPFPMLSFHYIFQVSVDDKQSIEEDEERTLRYNFIFFTSLSFFYATNYLLDMNQI